MSVQSEIDRIITAVGNAYSKVSEKGGTVPASQIVANLATAIDSIPAGVAKETWVIKSDAAGEFATTQISFTSNGQKFTSIGADYVDLVIVLHYDNNEIAGFDPGASAGFEFYNEAYRKLTFDAPPTGALFTWLQANGVKQPDDTAVQDTKALTITSNGTISVTPDVPYDALSSVDVTVDVAGSGGGGGAGFSVTFPATATDWGYADVFLLLLEDGTIVNGTEYSVISAKTFDSVVGIKCYNSFTYMLRMTLSTGAIAQIRIPSSNVVDSRYSITNASGTTPTYFAGGSGTFWWPIADTVISAIEMYNTD